MNNEKDDENPWDDDGGGRTLATDGPSFEMPADIPSPITAPPPPITAPPPAGAPRPAPRPAAARALHSPVTPGAFGGAFGTSPLPPPMVLGDDDLAQLPGPHEDGRTLAVSSPVSTRPPRDDAGFGYVPSDPENDRDAETMAALSRDELLGHRDALVVVGHGAAGEDATLAIGPGQLNQLLPQHQQQQLSEQLQQPEHHDAPPPPSWQGFDPMMPQSNSYGGQNAQGQFLPPSGQHPSMVGPQSSPMSWGPNPDAQTAFTPAGAYPHPQHSQQPHHLHHAQQEAPPMMQPAWAPQPAPEGAPSTGIQFTPQVLLLIGVGVLCLAIFVIGVVLFATTKL